MDLENALEENQQTCNDLNILWVDYSSEREAIETFTNQMSTLICQALENLKETWNTICDAIGENLKTLSKICDWDEPRAYEKVSPKTYGISLIKKLHKSHCSGYFYKPVFKRNLPYQRRSY